MVSIFALIIIPLILILLLKSYQKSQKSQKNLPPGNTGWPILGETLEFISNPEKFTKQRMKKYSSEIFKTSFAGGKMAVLCGPQGNKFIFSNETNKVVKSWWPKSISQHLLFDNTGELLGDDHSFLKLESIQQFVHVMDSMVRDHLDTCWVPYQEVKVHPLSKEFTFALACRVFLNYVNPSQVKDLAEPFFDVAKGIMSAPINIPGTPFNGAVKGGALIKERLLNIIKQRREELQIARNDDNKGECNKDLLSKLLISCHESGKFYNEKEIVNKIVGYLLASFYTTSVTITFVLSYLAEYPEIYDKVLKEQLEISKSKGEGEVLKWGDIKKMKYTWNVVCESMRMTSPSQGAFKETLTEITYAGFTIPKGWKVSWSVHSTHKDPKFFKNPEKFDPSRFEGTGPPPYTFVPFGGGPRMCAGKEYARVQILAFVRNVVTRFKLKKGNPNEKIVYNVEPIPVEGLRICLEPHQK